MKETLSLRKLSGDDLGKVAGGKGYGVPTHASCPAGAIEMKWNLDHFPCDRKAKHGCPVCGANLRDQKFWFQDTCGLYNGYICERDNNHRWIYGSPI